jgi:hypothetical protein
VWIVIHILLVRLVDLLFVSFLLLPAHNIAFPCVTVVHTEHLVGFVFKVTPSQPIHEVAHPRDMRSKSLIVSLVVARMQSAVGFPFRRIGIASFKCRFDCETLGHVVSVFLFCERGIRFGLQSKKGGIGTQPF